MELQKSSGFGFLCVYTTGDPLGGASSFGSARRHPSGVRRADDEQPNSGQATSKPRCPPPHPTLQPSNHSNPSTNPSNPSNRSTNSSPPRLPPGSQGCGRGAGPEAGPAWAQLRGAGRVRAPRRAGRGGSCAVGCLGPREFRQWRSCGL